MPARFFKAVWLWLGLISLGGLACDLSTLGLAPAAKPQVVIQSPAPGTTFKEGDEVMVQSIATDSAGIARVELLVDGATVQTDAPPIPKQTSFTLIQKWVAAAGAHTLSVRAYSASGASSDPVLLAVTVTPAVAQLPSPQPPVVPPTLVIAPPIGAPTTIPSPIVPAAPSLPALTPTTRPATRPAPSPTILSAPPGVYATAIRVDPAAPKRNAGVRFHVMFWNNTGSPQTYRWRIRIFEPDKRNSFGDTTPITSNLPNGVIELASSDNWKVGGPGDCLPFIARVFAIDPGNNQEFELLKPDASGGPAVGFQVCP